MHPTSNSVARNEQSSRKDKAHRRAIPKMKHQRRKNVTMTASPSQGRHNGMIDLAIEAFLKAVIPSLQAREQHF